MVTDPLYDYRGEYITVFLPVRSTSWDQPCRVIGRVVRRTRVGVSGPRHLDHPPPFAVETEYGRRKTRSTSHRITDLQAFLSAVKYHTTSTTGLSLRLSILTFFAIPVPPASTRCTRTYRPAPSSKLASSLSPASGSKLKAQSKGPNEMIPLRLFRRLVRRLATQSWPVILATLASALVTWALCLYLLLAYYLADDPRLVPDAFRHARRPILITAHPDDETLFFSPSILYHRHDGRVTRSLLVISSGKYTLHGGALALSD